MQSIAVYLHVYIYMCLVITIEYRSALPAIILMGGAAASETLIGGYVCTIGGCNTPQNSPERTLVVTAMLANRPTYSEVAMVPPQQHLKKIVFHCISNWCTSPILFPLLQIGSNDLEAVYRSTYNPAPYIPYKTLPRTQAI